MKNKYVIIYIVLIFLSITGFNINSDNARIIKYINLDISFINSQNIFDSLRVCQYGFSFTYNPLVKSNEDLNKLRTMYRLDIIHNCSRCKSIYLPYKYTQTFTLNLNDTLFNGDVVETYNKTNGGLRIYSTEIFLKNMDYYAEHIYTEIYTLEEIDTSYNCKVYYEFVDESKNLTYKKRSSISGDTLYISYIVDMFNTKLI